MDTALEHTNDASDCLDLPPISRQILSLDGTVVDTHPTIWRVSQAAKSGMKYLIDWGLLDRYPLLTGRARHLLKLYLADQLTKKKASTVCCIYRSLRNFVRWLTSHASDTLLKLSTSQGFNWSGVNEGQARAFLEWGVKHTAQKGYDFTCLRAFYEWGIARGYSDFQRDLLGRLKTIKAPGNAKGHHVRFRHPIKGPFSSDELFQIRSALHEKKGTDQDRAIVMLHLELGLNPYASVQMTNADFKRYETEHLIAYQIDVPRIKKRTIHRETKRRPISNKLGQLLEHLQRGGPEDPLLHWLTPSDPQRGITNAMCRFVKTAGIVSFHTGTLLKVTPRRFRTSLATHMAAQGASKIHIAEILDHTGLEYVEVYTQTVSSIADQMAKATDPIIQPLVQRFLGKIADSTEAPMGRERPHQQIPALAPHLPLPVLNAGGIGSCGRNVQKDGLCQLLPPLSCYLCPSFVAFRSGPHQEMLDSLLNFRRLGEGMIDERIKRQLDDVCTAIAEVLVQLGKPVLNQDDGTKVEEKENAR